jgi:hypothetical protein
MFPSDHVIVLSALQEGIESSGQSHHLPESSNLTFLPHPGNDLDGELLNLA